MALVTPVFLDTTVLLEGLIDLGPQSRASRAILDAVAEGRLPKSRTAWHSCLEFYAVSTRLPEEYRLTPEDADRLIVEGILEYLEILELPAKARRSFLAAAGGDRLTGGRIHDAHLAEIARLSGSKTVITGNLRHWKGLAAHGIRVLTPGEVELRR